MMNKIFGILIAFVLLAFTSSDNSSVDEKILQQIGDKLQSGEVFRAQLEHEFLDAFTNEITKSYGDVFVGHNKYMVHTSNQYILVDGEFSWVYNRDQNQVIISHYFPEDDDFAPSRFLSDYESVFHISDVRHTNPGYVELVLRSDDPFEILTLAEVTIRQNSIIPVRIYAEDQSGNQYHTFFNEGRFLASSEVVFEIEWPEDAEIIDLRED